MGAKDGDDLIGKLEEKVGWLTADREAEAKGKLRRLGGDDADDADDAEESEPEAADTAQKDLRGTYGEYDPAVDDKPVAKDVRPSD